MQALEPLARDVLAEGNVDEHLGLVCEGVIRMAGACAEALQLLHAMRAEPQ